MLKYEHLLVLIFIVHYAACSPMQISPRIVGGDITDITKHPYLVSFRVKSCENCAYIHKCAGVIYSNKVVITAAQCLIGLDTKWRLMVVAGANSRSGADGIQIPVAKHLAHPKYDYWTIENDIGLVFLDDELPLNDIDIKAIDIAKKHPLQGQPAIITGWGWDAEDGKPTFLLHDVVVFIVDNESCEKAYGIGEVTEKMICAGVRKGGKDGCQGDTGGPLVVKNELVGLVSWGRGCGREGYPGVYTNVPFYKEWINETITEMYLKI